MNESGPPTAPPPSTVEGACAPIGAGRAVRPREFRVSGSRRTSRTEVPHPAGAALESAPGRAVAARRFRWRGGGARRGRRWNPLAPKLTEPRFIRPRTSPQQRPDRQAVINDNYFCRSPWWRWAGRGSTRGACDTARFPHGGRVGHGCAGSAIAREADGRQDVGGQPPRRPG